MYRDDDGPWPGNERDPKLIVTWTPTRPCCDVGDRAVAAIVIPDEPDADVAIHALQAQLAADWHPSALLSDLLD